MSEVIVNRVAESILTTINLEDYYPKEELVVFDIKEFLFMGLIIKEKEFREALKVLDLKPFENKHIAINCSTDAIIPMWAYMLVASYLQPIAASVNFGTADKIKEDIFLKNINQIEPNTFMDKRIVIKGCGELPIVEAAYICITALLRPVAKSIMYGEPCSTVPIFKKARV